MHGVRHGLHQLGLAHAGDAFKQDMAAREQAGHDVGDDILVANDHAGDLVAHSLELVAEGLDLPIDNSIHWSWLSCRLMK